MPATLTYPGVYIEEIPSGVHTITGVATSITAFVGWAPQGPVSEATLVESWVEYEAIFGGLDYRSKLGYAVNQFFGNGGQQAYIVRLVWDGSLPPAPGTNPSNAATAVAAGLGYGRTQITAALGSITSDPVTLSVGAPVLQSIAITPENLPSIPINATGLTFTATGTNSDGTTVDLTAGATWSSSDKTSVIAVGPGGVATPNGPGTAVITATSGLISGSITVTVTAASLTSVTVSPAGPLTLDSGQTQQFSATGHYVDGTTQDLTGVVTWSPNADFSQATATSPAVPGLFVQTTVGPHSVTAAWVGVTSAVTNVTVAVVAPVSLIVARVAATMTTGTTQAFNAELVNSDGSTASATATWASSNTAVATFGGGNTLSAVAVGTTTLTATSGAFSATTTVTVTAATLQSITVTPAAPTIAIGQSLQLKAVGVYNDGTTADLTGCSDWAPPGGGEVQVSQQKVTVTNGVVTLSNGSITGVLVTSAPVTVTASFGGKSGTAAVSVTAAVLTKITVAPATTPPTILTGQTLQFNATGHLSGGGTLTPIPGLTWASSNTSVATINASSGLARGVGSGGSLTLFANNPGAWGNNLRVTVTVPSPNPNSKFNLLVQEVDAITGAVSTLESFSNLSVTPTDPQYAVTVVDNDSNYLTFLAPGATPPPPPPNGSPSATADPVPLSGGADGATLLPAIDQNFELVMLNDPLGVFLLRSVDIFNLLCVPGETDAVSIQKLQNFCFDERAFYIVDPPQTANHASLQKSGPVGSTNGSITSTGSQNSAYYFPWVLAPDPLFGNRPTLFPPCGFVAGIYAATDANRGVWKAPAGIAASLTGVSGLQYVLTDEENGDLNVQAINCLRQFHVYGDVVWGARTLQGNDQAGSEWKYLSIRRTALYIESSLLDGTQWVVFEPNDEKLWSQIRLNVGAFMQDLFVKGAFAGTTPQQAYFVKCDAENNPQSSIDQGIVNILVGFAPLYPAEFVVIQIQQMAGQLQT